MIATKILVVKCDGCGMSEIFAARPFTNDQTIGDEALEPDLSDGWIYSIYKGKIAHYCPECKDKKR